MPVFLPKRGRRNLLDGLALDAPYVTEIRRLLQNLYRQEKGAQAERRSYMVTSAARGEGKSTICTLMAILSARIFHKRTLLLDGDLHRPTIHSLLGVSRAPGLIEILRERADVREATHATSLPFLWVIPSGYPRDGISESYADERFGRVLQGLRAGYDVVFVDAPPSVPTIEPTLMAEHVDALLLVAMAGRTPLAMVRRSMQILRPVEDKIVGVVLNNAVDGLPYYFNYRYYGYEESKTPRTRRSVPPRRPEPKAGARTKDTRGGS